MKKINGGKQMRDAWALPAIAPWEKAQGKHKWIGSRQFSALGLGEQRPAGGLSPAKPNP